MIFVVSDDLAVIEKVSSDSFTNLSIWERQHIEQWVLRVPEILGEDLLIVSTEFDRFNGSRDRLDILAVDRAGNLVVVELKRDSLAAYADLQGIRYAAMVSAMTIEKLLPYYVNYQRSVLGLKDVTEEASRIQVLEFVESESFEELTSRPRIILCSEDFSQEMTTTVLWLRQFGVDISCVKITPHRLDSKVVVVSNRIIPLQEASQYLIDIQEKEEHQQEREVKRQRTIKVLVENGLLRKGDKIYLRNALPSFANYDADNPMFVATITGKLGQANAVQWENDQQEYAISRLTAEIFRALNTESNGMLGAINGNAHWVNEDNISLWDMAENYLAQNKR